MTPGEGALRLTRTAVFAVSAVGLASAAHLAADGDVPRVAVLVSVPLVMLVVHLLASVRRGPVSLFLGMGLTQAGLHLAFMTTSVSATCSTVPAGSMSPTGSMSPAGSMGPAGSMAGMAMPGGHGHVAICESGLGHGGLLPTPSMFLAHLLAMLVVVAVLARGEAAVWALAAGLRFTFSLPRVELRLPAMRRLPVSPRARRHPAPAVHLRSIRRRGPPVVGTGVPA